MIPECGETKPPDAQELNCYTREKQRPILFEPLYLTSFCYGSLAFLCNYFIYHVYSLNDLKESCKMPLNPDPELKLWPPFRTTDLYIQLPP